MGKLAIRAHKSRGKEVIEILEMLGGKNVHNYNGTFNECYVIDNGKICSTYTCVAQINGFVIITLEEFIKKYPYKVGDRVRVPEYESEVRINDMKWDGNEVQYEVFDEFPEYYSVEELNLFNEPYKEELIVPKFKIGDKVKSKHNKYTYEISQVSDTHYTIIDIEYKCKYTEPISEDENWELLQEETKEETMDRKYNVEEYLKVWEETEKGLEVVVNDRFELKEDNGKFYIIKKQPQYPTTYNECCEVLGLRSDCYLTLDLNAAFTLNAPATHDLSVAKEFKYVNTLEQLRRLLICRGAYWQIAGEQMGLGKPWEPDWTKADERKYCIVNTEGNIREWVQKTANKIFAFPTEEMQNAFKVNFEADLEFIKEFL